MAKPIDWHRLLIEGCGTRRQAWTGDVTGTEMPALFAELARLADPSPLITKSELDQPLLRPLREQTHL